MRYKLNINNSYHEIEAEPNMPLLWVLRDIMHLTGTKYGCGKGLCGACTIHLDSHAIRSCLMKIKNVGTSKITTIEGLSLTQEKLHPIQQAWIDADVPQCGYCQSGQIMQASSMLNENPNPSDSQINNAMKGNLCRCGTYTRIKTAIKLAQSRINGQNL